MITFQRLGHYGQLGNQLWQYATLRALALRHNTDVAVPQNHHLPKRAGLYELTPFQVACRQFVPGADVITGRYEEASLAFDPQVLEQPDGTDLHGYFQSFRYWSEFQSTILADTMPLPKLAQAACGLFDAHTRVGPPVIAVNVRRDDYTTSGGGHVHMVLAAEYYLEAIASLKLSGDYQFLVVSDDLAWCRQKFKDCPAQLSYLVAPDHWQQLATMMRCAGIIGSASSFSWWAAFHIAGGLCCRHDTPILFPDRWYGPRGPEYCLDDILPGKQSGWIRRPAIEDNY